MTIESVNIEKQETINLSSLIEKGGDADRINELTKQLGRK